MTRDAMLLLLTGAAGIVDAISYLGLGHVFTAMMTGNTVLLGLALAQGAVYAALRSLLALFGFVAGVALGALFTGTESDQLAWPPGVTRALTVEAVLLAAFAVVWGLTVGRRSDGELHVLIALSGLAMGVQSAAVRRLGVPGIATTFITGTLTNLVIDVVAWHRATPGDPVRWEQRIGLLAGVFVVYGLGAFLGAFFLERAPRLVTTAPLLAVVAVVTSAARQRAVTSIPARG